MNTVDIKRFELIQFIMQANESLLDKAKDIFLPTNKETIDWWDDLSQEQKTSIEKGIEDINRGRTKSHSHVMAIAKRILHDAQK